jgi:uronate dehydrogenase
MSVLFVGATGVIGSRVIPHLLTHCDLKLAALESGEIGGQPVQAVDITNFEATEALVQQSKVDAVINCAVADYREHQYNREQGVVHRYHESVIDVNMRGCYHLYEAAARARIPKFVFISSLSILIGSPWYERITGVEMPRPDTFYACSKYFGEQIGALYSKKFGLSVTCLRLGHPFPLNDDREVKILADDRYRSHLVHFEDIAQAIKLALQENLPFSSYPIVSACDVPWVAPEATFRLGYQPQYRFTPQGAENTG